MATPAQIRLQVRNLESQTELLLGFYSKFLQSTTTSANQAELNAEKELQDILKNRQDSLEQLRRVTEQDNKVPATKLQQLQRHTEILNDHKREYLRIKENIQQERNRLNLLFSVRNDIETHRARSTPSNNGRTTAEMEEDYMLQERSMVDNSNNLADRLLAQAYETREEFSRQSATLANAQRKMFTALSHIPGINTIISKVNMRKKRDSLIIASLVTVCILLVLFFR